MFLEERLPIEIDYGSNFGEQYDVDVTQTKSKNVYKRLISPYPTLTYQIGFGNRDDDWLIAQILDMYHRVGGMFGGFRLKNLADYTTNNYRDAPTSNDQAAVLVSTGVYQATRWYGTEGGATSTRRRLRKPVSASMLVGIRDDAGNPHSLVNGWSVDYTNGEITFDADSQLAVTDITQAAQAVLTVGGSHGRVVDDSIHISAVSGMTEINGLRGTVVSVGATTITVDIDSQGFSAYTSGGQTNTRPQTNETVTCGCEFDIPMMFETDLDGVTFSNFETLGTSISIVELLNP